MSNTPYVHPNGNQYTTCPCEITSLTDCRSKEDPITYESLEGEPIKNVVVLPSGYCVTTDILKQFRKWEDPLTRMKLSKENKYYELMIDNKPELDPELDPALVQNLIDQIGLDHARQILVGHRRNRELHAGIERSENRIMLPQQGNMTHIQPLLAFMGTILFYVGNLSIEFVGTIFNLLYSLGFRGNMGIALCIILTAIFDSDTNMPTFVNLITHIGNMIALFIQLIDMIGGGNSSSSKKNVLKNKLKTYILMEPTELISKLQTLLLPIKTYKHTPKIFADQTREVLHVLKTPDSFIYNKGLILNPIDFQTRLNNISYSSKRQSRSKSRRSGRKGRSESLSKSRKSGRKGRSESRRSGRRSGRKGRDVK